MNKAVLIPIRPEWCAKIMTGEKTIELRKTKPKIPTPFRCYIYETRGFQRVGNENLNCVVGGKGRGAVIGEFICDQIEGVAVAFNGGSGPLKAIGGNEVWFDGAVERLACLSTEEICRYVGGIGGRGYGWHISSLKVYDEPKKLSEFSALCPRVYCQDTCPQWKHNHCDRLNNGVHPVTRPPQSWMFVEERGGES